MSTSTTETDRRTDPGETKPQDAPAGCPWWDHDQLYQAYVTEDKTPAEIADDWVCGETTIRTWLDDDHHDIQRPTQDGDE